MDRTFSEEARAVVPTTHGFTSAIPSAGSMRTKTTSHRSGTASRTGPIQDALIDPSRK